MRALAGLLVLVPVLAAAADNPPAPPPGRPVAPAATVAGHPEWDAAYTEQIRSLTTDPQFLTTMVDHLPASDTVPSPLEVNGTIAGAAGHLTSSEGVVAYMRALAAASPRVEVFDIGRTEEGREMILVAVADEATIASLDRYREITRRLADPRTLSGADAQALIAEGKPMYYVTGGLHSPETGSPEMLMELAYRLAVEDTPLVAGIRSNVITLITPVLEPDGRDRMVDLVHWQQKHPDVGLPPFVYWGHYVGHDNNRDAIGMALALSRNVERAYFEFHPQVLHDLHESIPFLYVSSGTGPYNAWLDPLMVDEWERMAYHEVQTLTAEGLPGVWTHGFYDGWAPNYLFWVAMGHNSVGRFFETFGNAVPDTQDRVVRDMSTREWFRPNPPLPQVRWSLRNNVNYQESGILSALSYMASNRRHFLAEFYELGRRSVAKATTEGPAAYVFPATQKRQGQLHDLMALLGRHGIEVSVADAALSVKRVWPPQEEKGEGATSGKAAKARHASDTEDAATAPETLSFPAGSFVVRMDQPYSRLADALLDTQYVRSDARVYDDTGWTLGYARNLEFTRVVNPAVLDAPMHRWSADAAPARAGLPRGAALAVANAADTDLVRLRFALPKLRMLVLEEAAGGAHPEPAGTVIIPMEGVDRAALSAAAAGLHLSVTGLDAVPGVKAHELAAPRIALLHTWLGTQEEGWYRLALEDLGVPYDYISTQDAAAAPDLRSKYDVILFPPVGRRGDARDIVNGMPDGPPLPWKRSELTPSLGAVDSTDDMRPGLGLAGVENLERFVRAGGLLVTVQDTAEWAMEYGLARYVSEVPAPKVKAPGTLVEAEVTDASSPVAWGYDATVPVYFTGGPVLRVGVFGDRHRDASRPSGRGSKDDPDVPQGRRFVPVPPRPTPGPGEKGFQVPEGREVFYRPYVPRMDDRPRVVLSFPDKPGSILLSGMLAGAEELAGTPLVVDAPLGSGHVLLFAINPMWRFTTQGSYALLMNAVMNFDHLSVGWPPKTAK